MKQMIEAILQKTGFEQQKSELQSRHHDQIDSIDGFISEIDEQFEVVGSRIQDYRNETRNDE